VLVVEKRHVGALDRHEPAAQVTHVQRHIRRHPEIDVVHFDLDRLRAASCHRGGCIRG
jgi:hypothetical protein